MKRYRVLIFVIILSLATVQAIPTPEAAASESSEKKSPIAEEPARKKLEIIEETPAISVEGAEEIPKVDRAKKSASTTFCVEIRPGPSEAPVKICENPAPSPPPSPPQIPHESHEIHEQPPPPPPPTFIQESQSPILIIPPPPSEIFVPNDCPPQIPSQQSFLHFPQILHPPSPNQQIIIPSGGSPCPEAPQSLPQQQIIVPGPASYPQFPPQSSQFSSQQQIIIPGPASCPQLLPQSSQFLPQQNFVNPGPASCSQLPPQSSQFLPQQNFVYPGPASGPTSGPASYPQSPQFLPQQNFVISGPASGPASYPQSPQFLPQQNFVISGPAFAPASYPQPPQFLPQQNIVIPGPASYSQSPCLPCSSSGSGIHPQALPSQFRYSSSISPTDPESSSIDGTQMRSNSNEESGINSGAKISSSGIEKNRDIGDEKLGTSHARTHLKKLHGIQSSSSYPSGFYDQRSPYVVRCNPQLLSLGNGGAYAIPAGRERSSNGAFNAFENNGQTMILADGQNVDVSRHVVIQPMVQPHYGPGNGYPPSYPTIPSISPYQSSFDPYSLNHQYSHPGYSLNNRQPSLVMPSISVHSHPGFISSGSDRVYRRDQQRRQQSQSQKQEINENKSSKRESEDRESTNKSEEIGPFSATQMLDRMRGSGGNSGLTERPIMRSFPRIKEERSKSDDGVNLSMNIPRGSHPFMIAEPRNSGEEKNFDTDENRVKTHDDIAKREVEKSAIKKKD